MENAMDLIDGLSRTILPLDLRTEVFCSLAHLWTVDHVLNRISQLLDGNLCAWDWPWPYP
jgi:hypothetical protein